MPITVHGSVQAKPGYGNAFLNINAKDLYVEAWTSCYQRPTYLCQYNNEVHLIQFESEAAATEWIEEQGHKFGRITEMRDRDNRRIK